MAAIVIVAIANAFAVAPASIVPCGANLVLYVRFRQARKIHSVRQGRCDGVSDLWYFIGSALRANYVTGIVVDGKVAVNVVAVDLGLASVHAVARASTLSYTFGVGSQNGGRHTEGSGQFDEITWMHGAAVQGMWTMWLNLIR